MNNKIQSRIFLVIFVLTLSFSMISNAYSVTTLSLSPSTGSAGTTITATGKGFTPSSYSNTEHNYLVSHTASWYNKTFLEKWTGLPSGTLLKNLTLNFLNKGSTSGSQAQSHTVTHTTGWTGAVRVEPFTNIPNATITKLALSFFSSGSGHVRIKAYSDSGGSPNALLGESGSQAFTSTAGQIINFTISATVPASGKIWVGFEIDNATTSLYYTTGLPLGSDVFTAHAYGSGPSPFGAVTQDTAPWDSVLYYTYPTPQVRIKAYSDSGGSPSALLGESGSQVIPGNGLQNFTISATVPASGNIWAGFEVNNPTTDISYTTGQPLGTDVYTSHIYGSGPSPFGAVTQDTAPFYANLRYLLPTVTVSFTWDGVSLVAFPPSPTTNSTGGFTGVILISPVSLVATHTVTATDSNAVSASTNFDITLPITSSTISGTSIFGVSNVTPTISLSSPIASVNATKNELYRNGTLVQTNNLSPNDIILTGIPKTISSIGETMVGTSSYFVNTTMTDGFNTWITKSNSIIISKSSGVPTNGKVCSIDFCPSQTLINYTVHRTPDYKTLIMTVNMEPTPFHTECNILNGTFAAKNNWHNYTNVYAVNFTAHVPYADNVYFACYGSGPLLSGMSPGNGTLPVQGANVFNQTFGITLGAPIGVFFIAMLASLGNQRTGPIYVVVTLAAIGIMSALLFFTVSSGAWALVLITGFLGIFVGRKIF